MICSADETLPNSRQAKQANSVGYCLRVNENEKDRKGRQPVWGNIGLYAV
jgi:hypothetical protein